MIGTLLAATHGGVAEAAVCHPSRGQRRSRRGRPLVGRPRLLFAACAMAVACLALMTAPPAHGGTYRAAICNPDLGAGHADATFAHTSPRYRSRASCATGGVGLSVTSHAATRGGRWGAWMVAAPRGTAIRRLSLSAAGRAGGGRIPEILRGTRERWRAFAVPSGELARFRWSGAPTLGFAARLRCRRVSGCPRGRPARLRVKRLALLLDDRIAPRLRLAGSLFAPGSRRGGQAMTSSGSDFGAGLRGFLLQVNGQPVAGHTLACRLTDGVAVRLRPCRRRASTTFRAITESPPFRQGPNAVRVCASDYAASTAANRVCARHRVRVDNLCPTSKVSHGATVRAWIRRKRAGAIVAGRLLDGGRTGRLGRAGVRGDSDSPARSRRASRRDSAHGRATAGSAPRLHPVPAARCESPTGRTPPPCWSESSSSRSRRALACDFGRIARFRTVAGFASWCGSRSRQTATAGCGSRFERASAAGFSFARASRPRTAPIAAPTASARPPAAAATPFAPWSRSRTAIRTRPGARG